MTFTAGLEITGNSDGAQRAVTDLEKNLKKANTQFTKQASTAKAAALGLNQASAAAGRMNTAIVAGGRQAAGAVSLSTHELANMQFQMQDIAVGLASGQSPFRIIAQQGSQIVQIFKPGTGVSAAMRAFGGGVTSFITNPLNIALLGMVAAAGGIQLLTSQFNKSAAAVVDKKDKVLTLTDAIKDLDGVSGRANKTHAEEIRLARIKVKELVNEEVSTRNLIRAKLELAISNQKFLVDNLQTPGVAAGNRDLGLLRSTNRVSGLKKQLEKQNKEIAKAKASLRGVIADDISIDIEGQLDPAAAINLRLENAQAAVRKEFEAGSITAEEFRQKLLDLSRAQDAEIEAARKAEAGQKKYAAAIDTARGKVIDLLASQERELAILNESNPVKAELIRLSEKAAAATGEERKQIEANVVALQAAKAAQDAVEQQKRGAERVTGLVGSLRDELAVLREADPVQREMIRLRETMTFATGPQIERIQSLVGAIERERVAQTAASDARRVAIRGYENLKRVASGALDAAIVRGEKLGSVLKRVGVQLAAMAAQALLLGQGPLSSIFGGGGSSSGGIGGIIGLLLGGGRVAAGGGGPRLAVGGLSAANGGFIQGPGTSTSDSIPARLSDGEFVVNAAATRRNRPALEAINSGRGFAHGGMVGSARKYARGGFVSAPGGNDNVGAPGVIQVNVVGARGNAEIASMVETGVRKGFKVYDSSLPLRIRQINADPRLV